MLIIRLLVVAFFFAAAIPAKATPARIALVITNSEYRILDDLPNPRLDGINVRRVLGHLGYRVSFVHDGTRNEILGALQQFAGQVERLEPGSVVLVYYGGHGFEVDGTNYIAPTDASSYASSRDNDLIDLRTIFNATQGAEGLTRLFLVDACRTLPNILTDYGFVREDAPPDSLIGFSTGLGTTATDGAAGAGSPFAIAFADWIQRPGINAPRLMQAIQAYVLQATATQRPVYYSNARADIALSGDGVTENGRRTTLAYQAIELGLYADALQLSLQSARQGDIDSMLLSAGLYSGYYGTPYSGIPIDLAEARRWHDRAMRDGGAYQALAWAYFLVRHDVRRSDQDNARIIQIITESARRAHPWSMFHLGLLAQRRANGARPGAPERVRALEEAVDWYGQSAGAGYYEAAVNLGIFFQTGIGVSPNRERALELYRQAAERLPRGQTLYANLISTLGEGRRDAERDALALEWHGRASQYDPEAMVRLALAYTFGLGVTPDRARALSELDRYARQQQDPIWRNELVERNYATIVDAIRAGRPFPEPRIYRTPD